MSTSYPGNPAAEGAAAVRADDAARATLADYMRSLDQHLMLAIADAQLAHAEGRKRWKLASAAEDEAAVAAEWNSWRFIGDMLGQLQTLRGKL